MLDDDIISISSRESESDSGLEPGDKMKAESSDDTRPKKKKRQVSITAP